MANPNPTQTGTKVYSVWAFPPESVLARLKSVMSGLRSEFGGPVFEPHMTVVGAIRLTPESALEMIRSSTSGLRPYKVKVASVSRGTFSSQCIYLLIEPYKEVMEASAHVCGHFGYQRSTSYMPHLSLLYGDLTDEEKEKAVKKTEELDKELCGLEFEISELTLYKTDPEDKSLKSWEKIEVCRLDGK
ncbi:cyclic phosphodiesterase-like protein [Carex littledalei]|uniref:Cyclic phosphodiesterase-like protein n=1 Tax=Carex littledalei TaxID=544730 RepID=A0A833VYC7_9POAL|nr:cyclic phosphodiesterase-like protein [Carex littledalei]